MKTSKKHIVLRCLFLTYALCILHCAIAQQEVKPASCGEFEAKILFGSVLPHYSYMNYLSETYQKGLALHYTVSSKKITDYDAIWKFPAYGVGVRHITMGNAEKLGNLSMLYAVFNGRFYKKYTRVAPYYQINTGLAYAHKSMKKSLYNTAVSSPISFFAAINCGVQIHIYKGSFAKLGIELEHISNGKTTTPNLGLNSLLLTASYKHLFVRKPAIRDFSKPEIKNHRINLTASGFYKTDDFVTEKKYFTSVFSAEYEWLSNAYWWGLQAGGDYFYDRSIGALKPTVAPKKYMDVGIHAGAFVKYSHLVLLLHMGRYIGATTQNADFYTCVGLRYEWERLFANVSLRAHAATAQSIEMGVGYKIKMSSRNPPKRNFKKIKVDHKTQDE
ncbi:MAG: acyloxyacyl hydrolase [Bacteroidales bacterium]|nr:acyloxyacyl hydrolase [Bacteroidales bacterium]